MTVKGDKATCPVCGKEFTKGPHHPNQRYDTKACGNKVWRAAHGKNAEYYRRQKAKNPEYYRRRHFINHAQRLEQMKRWRTLNREKKLAGQRRYRAEHRESEKESDARRKRSQQSLRLLAGLAALEKTMNAQLELSAEKNDVKTWTTERLREEFAAGLKITRDHLLRLACILAELESRGEQVDGDKDMLSLIRRIGNGTLLVDAVVRFAGRPQTLATVGKMPPERQAEILGYGDEEVEQAVKKQRHRRPAPKRLPADNEDEEVRMPTFFGAAAQGTPKDVAAMCLKLIRESEDPAAVAAEMLPELQRLKNAPRAKKPARVGMGDD